MQDIIIIIHCLIILLWDPSYNELKQCTLLYNANLNSVTASYSVTVREQVVNLYSSISKNQFEVSVVLEVDVA